MRIPATTGNNASLAAMMCLAGTLVIFQTVSASDTEGWFEVTQGSTATWETPVDQNMSNGKVGVGTAETAGSASADLNRSLAADLSVERATDRQSGNQDDSSGDNPRYEHRSSTRPVFVAERSASDNPGRHTAVRRGAAHENDRIGGTINVDMFVGQVKIFGPVEVSRVANGNGTIIRAEVLDSGELMVIAQAEGSSSVRLWHKDGRQSDYNVRVSGADPETRVRRETMVRMRVRMVEFRKSALGKLGIDWSDSVSGPGLAIAADAIGNPHFRPESESLFAALPNTVKPMSAYFGIAANITSRINLLASTGDAKTLAEPVLSTMNGGTASFLAGGEVPYPTIGSDGRTIIQFKEYGVKLNVSPRIDSSGLVRTTIDTEISQLDPAVSVLGTPGLLTRKAQTEVNVRSGETIVISGLLSSESGKDIDKIPGIARLPVIGRLFRTQNARNSVSELVVFVTPEVVEPEQPVMTNRESRFLSTSNRRAVIERQKLPLMEK